MSLPQSLRMAFDADNAGNVTRRQRADRESLEALESRAGQLPEQERPSMDLPARPKEPSVPARKPLPSGTNDQSIKADRLQRTGEILAARSNSSRSTGTTSPDPIVPPPSSKKAAGLHARHPMRRSLDKPLPNPPVYEYYDAQESFAQLSIQDTDAQSDTEREVVGAQDVVNRAISGNTTDTTIHERMLPAVTHETIREDYHEIVEERITRDIHIDHIYHRVLPIKDIEVLPARHYVEMDGEFKEVSENQIPGRYPRHAQRAIAKGLSKMLPKEGGASGPRGFTARDFPGTEGDRKEEVRPDGSVYSERTWVYPPRLETGAMESGQTHALHIDD